MPLTDMVFPVRMERIAVAAPLAALRPVLVAVAEFGGVDFDDDADAHADQRRALSPGEPDLEELHRAGRTDLLAGEEELRRRADAVVRRGAVFATAGWCPADRCPQLRQRLAGLGGAVVRLARPRGIDPPSLLREAAFTPLVRTYGTVAYPDVDPSLFAGVAYVVMFGMMFGDAGHGLLLLAGALALRTGWWRLPARLRRVWPFIAGAGLASALFGALYGEFFGPTGVLPVLWIAPMEQPLRLLIWAVGLGAVLLSLAYVMAIVNRWREGGMRTALYASSGIAGSSVFLGLGLLAGGAHLGAGLLLVIGACTAGIGLVLAAIGLFAGSGGGAAGVLQTAVQLFDLVIRLGANLVSFARLAAFGLTHAALGLLVWQATAALWTGGVVAAIAAVLVFVVGNAVAFSLEALVAGVQALRLEFYELFSRMFEIEGRPFRPWRVPTLEERSS
ncbi:hypothetical protein GCM10010174_07300 [Kutzneria viridogrisea]|uniref:Uncharacterized protein n=2 Tax=Kutzneria TaxID=43356 RepID=W5W9R4_9PSEU|nr:V-type ATPase 116kDa subunit family protein [Kutzneria albida]AHH97505.1 hypothetical protein KALB_4141 [Kutzneria albida DSM 43870]MBA8930558.1 V/A-type H+-transporting ATPase subunit I [Kutzneria viridogrisea]